MVTLLWTPFYYMCFCLKMCLLCIVLLRDNNNNKVIYIGYYGVFNGLVKALWLNIALDFVSALIILPAFTRSLKPHNSHYKERKYINIVMEINIDLS